MALTKIDDRGLKTPIDLKNNEEIRLGDNNTFTIKRDSSNGLITTSTGQLWLASDDVILSNKDYIVYLHADDDGGLKINHIDDVANSSTIRFQTTDNGVQIRGANNKEHWCEGHYFPWVTGTYDIGGTESGGTVYYWRDGLFSRNLILRGDSGELRIEAAYGVDAFTVDSDNGNTIIGGSGTLTIPDTIVHAGDTNTKIRFPAADTVSVEAGGLEKLRIEGDYAGTVDVKGSPAHLRLNSSRDTSDWDTADPIGKLDYYVGLDTTNNLPYNAGFIHCLNETNNANEPSGALVFGTSTANASGGAVERLRITAAGNVGIKEQTPERQLTVKNGVHFGFEGTNAGYPWLGDTPVLAISTDGNNGSATSYADKAILLVGRGGGGAAGTTYGGVGVTTELFRVDMGGDVHVKDGDLKIGTSGHGVSFDPHDAAVSSPGSDSNLLDDYEEGTFTPIFTTGGSAFSTDPGYSPQIGEYTKVGNLVTVNIYLGWNNNGAGGDGTLRLAGLPFTIKSNGWYTGVSFGWQYWNHQGMNQHNYITAYGQAGQSYAVFLYQRSYNGSAGATDWGMTYTAVDASFAHNEASFAVTISYQV